VRPDFQTVKLNGKVIEVLGPFGENDRPALFVQDGNGVAGDEAIARPVHGQCIAQPLELQPRIFLTVAFRRKTGGPDDDAMGERTLPGL